MTQFENQHQTLNSKYFFQESKDWTVQLRGEQLQERWEQWSSVLGSLAVDASFLSVKPSQWDWVGKQRIWWEADLYICIGSSLYGGWISLMGSLASLTSLQANPSKGILLLACQAVYFGGDASLQDSWWGENRSVQDGTWIKRKQ